MISIESIEAALRTLGHLASEVPDTIALQQLAVIDVFLENPARPATEDLRGWALRSLLMQMISNALSEHRHYFDLAPVSLREKRSNALEHIKQDSQANSSVLLGWSILFYRYVRADLAITAQELADFANIHERTIRRERHDAVLRLRDKLIHAEWEARQVNQERLLRACIPEKLPKLIERDSEMNLALDLLKKDKHSHFFVTGRAGIGKTAFAAVLANRLIETQALDYLIWLSKPQDFVEVRHALEDRLLPYPSQVEISSLLVEYRTLLVLDDVEALIMQSEEWLELLHYLNHAIVIICNREHILFPYPVVHIPIQELSEFGINELIGTYPYLNPISKSVREQIWQTVGGNPRGIDYALRQIAMGNSIQFGDAALHAIYDELFEQLDTKQRWLCLWLATLSEGIDVETLSSLSSVKNFLFDTGLIEFINEHQLLRLVPSAKHYLELIVKSNKDLSIFATEQFALMVEDALSQSRDVSNIFLAILECLWLKIDYKTFLAALCACDTRILTVPQLWRWWRLADRLDEHSIEFLLLKAIAARRLLYYQEAYSILETVVQRTGRDANFKQQSSARYELAVLHQVRAEFDKAFYIYEQIESYLQVSPDKLLAEQIKRQQARIAIETRNAKKVLSYLAAYSENIQNSILLCEAYLIQGNGNLCRERAEAHLLETQQQPMSAASLYTIIGRSYEQEGLFDKALDYFNAALALTERFSTDFDIARARSNLATVYLRIEDKQFLDYAEELLQHAQSTQSIIQDTVGLLITERNLQHLHLLRLSK